ncbi:flagella export chaperone FliS [Pseudomonas sp. LTJR-52]|uniref:flagellar export chaperone FliS n=1 Tax=Pseudomonas sp. LTJR-52 TaxID=2479392 RepID=UPI000EFAF50B|nr:flagellar export chaperone FliS [Pseudomonas sp. LTJR-52]AYN94972.1 flagella export chaperone FliS [Pseudomonas sp. LTJR-52]
MNMSSALMQYQSVGARTQVEDASPHRLIQLLMESGLSRIAQAKGAMGREQYAAKGMAISKALAILSGLQEALDYEKGGDYARNLNALYVYMAQKLTEANRNNQAELLDEVAGLLRKVKEGWDAIAPV